MRRCLTVLLLSGFASASAVRAGDEANLAQALALQKTVQKTIRQAEPAIACILVSRSKRYEELGLGPDRNQPGKLGAVKPATLHDALQNNQALSQDDKVRYAKQLDFTDPGYVPRAFGSGVVIDPDGLILTNYHVVQDATKVFVRLPGGVSSYADIHAADPRSDLAVLKLLNPQLPRLRTVPLGSDDKVERGQFIVTLSNPFAAGFRDGQPSASWGILSNIRRRVVPLVKAEQDNVKPFHFYSTLLQTDARLNLGCSGGAILNLKGEMIGLITSTAAIQGGETPGGFAVPLTANVRRIIDVLMRGEEVDYGFLGIAPDRNPGNGRVGVMLTSVGPGSPAAQAKLQPRDILLAINGQPLRETEDIFVQIATHLAGTKVRLLVKRGFNPPITVSVTLAKLRVPIKAIASSTGSRPYVRGFRVDYSSLYTQQANSGGQGQPEGVFVSDVQPNSAADRAGLRVGAVITHVNRRAVASPAEFYRAMPAFGPVELTLFVPNAPAVQVQIR